MLVKICGLTRQADVDAALRLGANFCGFIFHEKSPRSIAPEAAARLDTGPQVKRVGVFVNQGAEEILEIMRTARLDLAQLHGEQSVDCARRIGFYQVIRVLWPRRYDNLALLEEEMARHADACAWYLLDAGTSGGGSGHHLDWRALAHLRPPHTWLLAGGLGPDNLAWATSLCKPDGVDVNSGIEDAPGVKNAEKMARVFATLKDGGVRA